MVGFYGNLKRVQFSTQTQLIFSLGWHFAVYGFHRKMAEKAGPIVAMAGGVIWDGLCLPVFQEAIFGFSQESVFGSRNRTCLWMPMGRLQMVSTKRFDQALLWLFSCFKV
jgi:hypothetical protein